MLSLCAWRLAPASRCNYPDCSCDTTRCFRVGQFRLEQDEEDWRYWVKQKHPHVVKSARLYVRQKRLCHHCGERLVPVGSNRANGAAHRDWASRTLHKKCWREILLRHTEEEMSGDETDGEP